MLEARLFAGTLNIINPNFFSICYFYLQGDLFCWFKYVF